MRKISMILFLATILSSGFIIAANQAQIEKEEEAIKKVIERQNKGWLTRNYEIEADVWAHEPYVVKVSQSGEQIIGWKAISARYKRKFSGGCTPVKGSKYTYSNFHFKIYKNIAWVTHEQVLKIPGAKEQPNIVGWESRILEKRDGKWKIVYHASRFLTR